MINALSEGLVTDEARSRLRAGTLLIINQIEGQDLDKLMIKFILPIFTRLVHSNHRFDILVSTYIEMLNQFMTAKGINASLGMVFKLDVLKSDEFDFEDFANQFMSEVDSTILK